MTTATITRLEKTVDVIVEQNATGMIATIPENQVIIKPFTIENDFNDSKIIAFLDAELKSEFHHDGKKLCFDYEITSRDADQLIITAVIAHQETIDQYYQAFLHDNMPLTQINIASHKKINLLPWRTLQQRRRFQRALLRSGLYMVICLLCALIFKLFLWHQTKNLAIKIQHIKQQTQAIHLQDPMQKNQQLLQHLRAQYPEKINSRRANTLLEKKLLMMANALPDSVTLQSLNMTAKKITIVGVGTQLSDIHLYKDTLQKNKIGRQVTLSDIHNDTRKIGNMIFTIQVS